jgi:prepilin-type N-terminal cleavage/methylation domain-containing protein
MSRLPAFTLIELIAVLAIMAIVTGISLQAMLVFRQTVQFQQAESDFISALRTTQNRARNSVSSAALLAQGVPLIEAGVDGYALFFRGNNYSMRYCTRVSAIRYDCLGVEQPNLKAGEFSDVGVISTDTNKCSGILFTRLNADILALGSEIGDTSNTGTCTVIINHAINPFLQRQIQIDLVNNNIDVLP